MLQAHQGRSNKAVIVRQFLIGLCDNAIDRVFDVGIELRVDEFHPLGVFCRIKRVLLHDGCVSLLERRHDVGSNPRVLMAIANELVACGLAHKAGHGVAHIAAIDLAVDMALGAVDKRDALDLQLRALPGVRIDLQPGIRRHNYLPGIGVRVARNAGGENHDLANAHMLAEIRKVLFGKLALDIRDDLRGSAQGVHAQQDVEVLLVPGGMTLGNGLGDHVGQALECSLVHAARSDVNALEQVDDLGVGGAIDDIEVVDARGIVDIMAVGYSNVVVALVLKLAHALHVHVVQVQAISCAREEQADDSPADLSRTENRNLARGFFSRHKIQSSLCR